MLFHTQKKECDKTGESGNQAQEGMSEADGQQVNLSSDNRNNMSEEGGQQVKLGMRYGEVICWVWSSVAKHRMCKPLL